MFDHIGLKVKNLSASVEFYSAALAELGYVLCSRDASSASFGPKGAPALWLYSSTEHAFAATHIAFKASERQAVDRFYEGGLSAGGRDHGKPGVRADYGERYYAAFLLDLDGNNVEGVCLE
jgi:catechol 2,3-dioxygenase-like lactoylglutathione lyase family enzyme